MSTSTERIPKDFVLIRLNETEHWNLPEKLKNEIGEIYTVHLFNRTSHTHCCEITPSYELNRLYTSFDWKDLLKCHSEEITEEIRHAWKLFQAGR